MPAAVALTAVLLYTGLAADYKNLSNFNDGLRTRASSSDGGSRMRLAPDDRR